MNVRDTLSGLSRELSKGGVEAHRVEAEILLSAVLGLLDEPRVKLLRATERDLSTAESRTLASLVLRRLSGEPVQYITRRAWFRDLMLEVGPGVLIPRPETESLAGEVIGWLGDRHHGGSPLVLDVGTGSGAIALAVAAECPMAHVVASDLSLDALSFATRNRARAERQFPGTAERVRFVAGDAFEPFRSSTRFRVVVSNPPYIGEDEAPILPREVRGHEPAMALFAPGGGLAVLERLIDEAPAHLEARGLLALEVGDGQAGAVRDRIAASGPYRVARVVRDLAGRERFVLAEGE